ncbi:hypothetical protein F5Y00DRAFT_223372 [Daldinia vernicosa]|uniref:uncharacterized protein n=1 Tax=Daldinia vernicosa TaxID=114800 RepID=UPI0020082847|nr:uncharacterized protein F5Y00DRAFT_223372 [Daldinia vernicosa]KAI0853710.1 hypothetical protein F5Y00DRAFT_223372 [Daldinia vernicosa]
MGFRSVVSVCMVWELCTHFAHARLGVTTTTATISLRTQRSSSADKALWDSLFATKRSGPPPVTAAVMMMRGCGKFCCLTANVSL